MNKKSIIAIALTVIIVAVISIPAYFLLFNKQPSSTDSDDNLTTDSTLKVDAEIAEQLKPYLPGLTTEEIIEMSNIELSEEDEEALNDVLTTNVTTIEVSEIIEVDEELGEVQYIDTDGNTGTYYIAPADDLPSDIHELEAEFLAELERLDKMTPEEVQSEISEYQQSQESDTNVIGEVSGMPEVYEEIDLEINPDAPIVDAADRFKQYTEICRDEPAPMEGAPTLDLDLSDGGYVQEHNYTPGLSIGG